MRHSSGIRLAAFEALGNPSYVCAHGSERPDRLSQLGAQFGKTFLDALKRFNAFFDAVLAIAQMFLCGGAVDFAHVLRLLCLVCVLDNCGCDLAGCPHGFKGFSDIGCQQERSDPKRHDGELEDENPSLTASGLRKGANRFADKACSHFLAHNLTSTVGVATACWAAVGA